MCARVSPCGVCTWQCVLQVILQMLLMDTFDMDLLETASSAVFALICCHHVCLLLVFDDGTSSSFGGGNSSTNNNLFSMRPNFIDWSLVALLVYHTTGAPCGLRGCKNGPAPFPGQMSYKATKPGLVFVLYLSMFSLCWCLLGFLFMYC